jgi:cell division protein FtsL
MNRKIGDHIRNPRIIGIWIAFMIIFIMELLFYTWCRVQYVRSGYEISEIAEIQKQLTFVRSNLKIEAARLKSPERIARIAGRKLGLIVPKPEQMIVIP